jgi:hypothetical protein
MNRKSRPVLASAALKQLSPRKTVGTIYYPGNRANNKFYHLREPSPLPSPQPTPPTPTEFEHRPRTNSVKRKNSDDSYATIVSGTPLAQDTYVLDDEVVEHVNVEIAKANTLCEKVNAEITEVNIPVALAGVINNLCEAISILSHAQGKLISKLREKKISAARVITNVSNSAPTGMTNLGNISKKQRPDTGARLLPPQPAQLPWIPAPSQVSKPTRSFPSHYSSGEVTTEVNDTTAVSDPTFADAIKNAEKSTLVFNLDMGTVPIMNKETIAQKATLALTKMAANKEKPGSSIPSEDVVAAIDDVLSVTSGYELYGTATKSYKHPTDPKSGAFCTVPVRYDFESKEDRMRAETVLRSKCNVNCAVPYPPLVRECIKQVVTNVKKEFPRNLVRVTIDTGRLCFNVSRRVISENKEEKNPWILYGSLSIPEEVSTGFDKKVPADYRISWPLKKKNSTPDPDPEEMETASQAAPRGEEF